MQTPLLSKRRPPWAAPRAMLHGLGPIAIVLLAAACAAPRAPATPDSAADPLGSSHGPEASAPSASGGAIVASAAGSGPVRFELAASGNEARYRAKEVLAGIGLTEAVGRTTKVTGAVVLDQSGSVIAGDSRITVDLRELRSDDSRRDGYIKDNTLQTARFPAAELVARELRGLASPLPTSGDVSFELLGDLTVHGVTRPSTWQARATVSGGEVRGTASTQATITGFGMEIPQVARVLSLEDTLTLEIDFRGTLSQ